MRISPKIGTSSIYTSRFQANSSLTTFVRSATHPYQYKFEGRNKHEQAAAFVTVLSGKHSPGLDAQGNEMEGFSAGSFTLDWNARAALPPNLQL
jgi:hypothetical protein